MLRLSHEGDRAEQIDLADIVIILAVLGRLHLDADAFHVGETVLIGHGLSEVKALHLFTADVPKVTELLLRLDAFRQGLYLNFLGHLHHGRQYAPGAKIEGAQKAHVHLNLIELKILQEIEGGIRAAEVIHPDLIPCPAELIDGIVELALLLRHHAFGDLDVEEVVGDLIVGDNIIDRLEDVAEDEIEARQIDRDRDGDRSGLNGVPNPCANLANDAQIQQMNAVVRLQHRDKLIGPYHAIVRIDPPGQRLKAAQLP